jgi:hypothetical protein
MARGMLEQGPEPGAPADSLVPYHTQVVKVLRALVRQLS